MCLVYFGGVLYYRLASEETHATKFSLLGPQSAAEESTCSLAPDTLLVLNDDIVNVTYTK